jgi:hypothetical protein
MRSISTAMSVMPVSALGQPNSRPHGADISYDRESPEHVPGCKCDQFGTRTSLNALLAFFTGQEDWDALALTAGRGRKHGLRMRIRCSVFSLFVRLCYQIQSRPFHSHPDHEGSESAAVEQAVSQSRSDLLGDLAFVVAVGSTWPKSTDHRDVSTCLKLLKSLASGSPDHHDPCLSLCHLLMSSGGAGSYFQATMCRML